MTCKQINYTPLHWLAYWNDAESIELILTHFHWMHIDKKPNIPDVMASDSLGMTPLDVAGKHGSREAANSILNFFANHFNYIHQIFDPKYEQA